MLDLEPATRVLCELITGVRDDRLTAPTPCADTTVGDLLDHIDGLSLAFAAAATKTPIEARPGPSADATMLGTDWRVRIPQRLRMLTTAWRSDSAWDGITRVGGVELPGSIAGLVAIDEVIVHGWDIAVGSGQEFTCEPDLVEGAMSFARSTVAESPQGTPGLFGPPVAVPDDAPALHRLLGLTGRDPQWRPAE